VGSKKGVVTKKKSFAKWGGGKKPTKARQKNSQRGVGRAMREGGGEEIQLVKKGKPTKEWRSGLEATRRGVPLLFTIERWSAGE